MTPPSAPAASFPISTALQDLMGRTSERLASEPPDETAADAFTRQTGIQIDALMTGLMRSISALETEVYLLRSQLKLELESPFDPPIGAEPWQVPDLNV